MTMKTATQIREFLGEMIRYSIETLTWTKDKGEFEKIASAISHMRELVEVGDRSIFMVLRHEAMHQTTGSFIDYKKIVAWCEQ